MTGKGRLVSGEIMAAAPAEGERTRPEPAPDILDAEFETLSARPAGGAKTSPAPVAPPLSGMAMLRGGDAIPVALGRLRGGPAFWTGGLFIVAAAFWFSGGHSLVPEGLTLRKTGTPQLRIASVVSRVDTSGPLAMLAVDGEAVNDARNPQKMLPLDIAVTAVDGEAVLYNLGTSGVEVEPGGKFTFASRLPMPRSGVKSVSVTFGRQH